MKCPRCWAEKAYAYPVEGWKGILLDCLLLTRMKCRHCFHKFTVSWLFTIGKQVTPPAKTLPSRTADAPGTVPFARSRHGRGQWNDGRRRSDAA
jgi:hypothetical protein